MISFLFRVWSPTRLARFSTHLPLALLSVKNAHAPRDRTFFTTLYWNKGASCLLPILFSSSSIRKHFSRQDNKAPDAHRASTCEQYLSYPSGISNGKSHEYHRHLFSTQNDNGSTRRHVDYLGRCKMMTRKSWVENVMIMSHTDILLQGCQLQWE